MFGMLLDLDAVQVKFNDLMKVKVTGKIQKRENISSGMFVLWARQRHGWLNKAMNIIRKRSVTLS